MFEQKICEFKTMFSLKTHTTKTCFEITSFSDVRRSEQI